ncbi:uncharacterized protein [Blastocystis hominis]|nr:uncharacterized protein [Blastocystis hominis]CBK25387.2 unnamed protein product [Blastocystis hominis]|eukprot:XP_012899435.1 uncharacterized protein [Blastocystis hominis]
MVVKTLTCSFSEYKIYPGHGGMYIRKDGQPVHFLNHKCCSLGSQKKKPARIRWTTAWRRNNKKIEAAEKSKRRSKKSFKVQKAICGMNQEIAKKSREAILAEIKNRRAKKASHK